MDSDLSSFPLSLSHEYTEVQRNELLIVCGYDIKFCSSQRCVDCLDNVMQVVVHHIVCNDWSVIDGSTF